ncbi:SMI1/KNR4 family protein [Streptomyces sp. MZ04]|uniref:SMI1/KNR4 family protein n=1 Tax=Streptomyces sp. MZ04 TaxID=2559236 RepID=UPI001FD78E2F|nr:SMI1/KNR4 family protein [Streptomyces sp. MZ04]
MLALRDAPNWRAVFGAEFGRYGHGFELRPVLTEEQVLAVEWRLGVALPAEYRSFLLQVGAGGAGPDYGLFPVRPAPPGEAPGDAALPFRPERTQELDAHECAEPQRAAYSDEEAFLRDYRTWDARHDELHEALTEGTLCVSEQGCAYYTLLAVTGPECGTMWDDVRAVGEGVLPVERAGKKRVTFAEWYLRWLDHAERKAHGTPPDTPAAPGQPSGTT